MLTIMLINEYTTYDFTKLYKTCKILCKTFIKTFQNL